MRTDRFITLHDAWLSSVWRIVPDGSDACAEDGGPNCHEGFLAVVQVRDDRQLEHVLAALAAHTCLGWELTIGQLRSQLPRNAVTGLSDCLHLLPCAFHVRLVLRWKWCRSVCKVT